MTQKKTDKVGKKADKTNKKTKKRQPNTARDDDACGVCHGTWYRGS